MFSGNGKIRILMIGDNDGVSDVTCQLLQEKGFETRRVSSGTDGLQLARELRPELILMDVVLPDMTGYEVCSLVKNDPNLKDIYIILVSSLIIDSDSQATGLEIGADDYIFSPIPDRELLARVEALIRLKRAEMALKESEIKFKTIADYANAWEYWLRPDGALEYVSPACERISGYSRENFIENPELLLELVFEEDREVAQKHLEDSSDKNADQAEFRIVTKDGETLWVQHVYQHVCGPGGEYLGKRGSIRDISSQKLAEEKLIKQQENLERIVEQRTQELQNSEDMFRSLFENTLDGIMFTAPDGSIFMSNPSACRILGLSQEEISRLGRDKLVDQTDGRLGPLLEIRRSTGRVRGEINYIHKDGHLIPAEVTSSIFYYSDGSEKAVVAFRDMTERRKMESALRETRDNLVTFFETLDDLVLVASFEKEIIFSNLAVSVKLGYDPSELESMTILELHPPTQKEEAERIFAEILEGKRKDCPLPLQKKNGDYLPTETRAWFGKWSGKDCVFAVCKDLSNEQEALQKFDRLFSLNPAPMVVSSMPERKITDVNDAFVSAFGFSREEIIGRTGKDLGLFVDEEDHHLISQMLLEEGGIKNLELQLKRKDGSIIDGLVWGEMIESQSKKSFLAVMMDVTEQKKTEGAIKESERRFRDMAELLPQAAFEIGADFKFTFMNTAGINLFGYTMEEFMGDLTPLPLVADEDRERVAQTISAQFNGGSVEGASYRAIKKDGSEFPVLIYSAPIVKDGVIEGIRGIVVDISRIKEAEEQRDRLREQLYWSQKMEALGTLVAGMAHDFNNMLQAIIGYAELLQAEDQAGSPGYIRLQNIIDTGQSGAELVRKLLAFSQQTRVSPTRIDLNDHVEQFVSLISRTMPSITDIELDLAKEPLAVIGDQGAINQALINLAINAAEAMKDGGSLHISTRRVRLDEEYCSRHIEAKPGLYAVISVRDTGAGMSEEVLKRIFDPFFSTKERGNARGTGLGLSVVRGIIQQHGGHITCESELEKGTEFKVCLPLIDADLIENKQTSASSKSMGQTILIVEDNRFVADFAETVLSSAGYSVIVSYSSLEAIEIFRNRYHELSLVIMDLVMPEMSGKDCIKAMLEIDPKVNVLVFSGYNPEDLLAEGIRSQTAGYLSKPCNQQSLLEAVDRVMKKKVLHS